MEMLIGIALLILFPLVIHARQQVDAAAHTRRRNDGDGSGGTGVVIDPSSCDGGAADGGSGCGGGCGGCGG